MSKQNPLRMCVVCRQMKEKKDLIRLVKNDNQIDIDETFKANGRGAYICRSKECIEKCSKTKALNRAFKCEVGQEVVDKLRQKV